MWLHWCDAVVTGDEDDVVHGEEYMKRTTVSTDICCTLH